MPFSTRPPMGRMMDIDYLLGQRRYPNAPQLAERLEVTIRTVYRDIGYMRYRFQAPIEFDREHNGYFYTEEGYVLPIMRLTEGELVAIFLAEKVLAQYSGSPYHAQLKTAFEKIRNWLPDTVTLNLSLSAEDFSFQPRPVRETEVQVFDKLSRAISDRRTLRMVYFTQSRNELTERLIDPYHILNYEGDWYLIARCHLRNALRDFAISRIRALEETDEFFYIPRNFDLEAYLKSGFGIEKDAEKTDVAIWFDSYQARWIREKRWDQSEEREERDDGSLVLRMRVPVTGELKRWILSYGSHAVVLEPEGLRKEMGEEVQRMVEIYRTES